MTQVNHTNQITQSGQAIPSQQVAPPPSSEDRGGQAQSGIMCQQPAECQEHTDELIELKKTIHNSANTSQQVVPKITDFDMQSWGSVKTWSDAQWNSFNQLVNSKTTGEEFMKAFSFKRRKDLEAIFYNLAKRTQKVHEINWQANYDSGAHSLPELKSGKDGLRISATRFKRYDIDVTPNTFFEFKKISDTEIILKIIR